MATPSLIRAGCGGYSPILTNNRLNCNTRNGGYGAVGPSSSSCLCSSSSSSQSLNFSSASSCNTYTKTFAGIDGAGKRLADEVKQVVKRTESLKRISFLAHSLGGLFARYAVAVLYSPNNLIGSQSDDVAESTGNSETSCPSRQVPLLEKLAPPVAPFLVGRTGSQLFLTDGKPKKPPLLLRMTSDCEDGKFLSALGAFRCRIVYANVSYDRVLLHHIYLSLHSLSLILLASIPCSISFFDIK